MTAADANLWTADTLAAVIERAREWLATPQLGRIVETFGGDPHLTADPAALLEWSTRTLDTREGRERHVVAGVDWPEARIDTILQAAAGLGLLNTLPAQQREYDLSVILGGTTLGNRLRVGLARDLLDDGVQLGTIMLLTADRPLSGRELTEARNGETTETANALRTAEELLGPLEAIADGDVCPGAGQDRVFATEKAGNMRLLVATAATGRPSTLDAVRTAVHRTPSSARTRVLVLSSAIYAPFQFLRIAPVLLHEGTRRVELVGTPTDITIERRALAQRLAQETHAAIHAAADLLVPTGPR